MIFRIFWRINLATTPSEDQSAVPWQINSWKQFVSLFYNGVMQEKLRSFILVQLRFVDVVANYSDYSDEQTHGFSGMHLALCLVG